MNLDLDKNLHNLDNNLLGNKLVKGSKGQRVKGQKRVWARVLLRAKRYLINECW